MRIGVFGGTFDPPHMGHLILAQEALDQLNLDRLLWVLTPDPPHKSRLPVSPVYQRLELLNAAISVDPSFELSRVELDRPGPHYVNDTVQILQRQYPQDEIIYLVGGDSLRDLLSWHEPQEFIRSIHKLGVMRRPGDTFDLSSLESQLPGLMEKLAFIDAPLLEISSREIRERIYNGRPYRYYLLPAVYAIIQQNHYYKSE